jgi:hypothetical protein
VTEVTLDSDGHTVSIEPAPGEQLCTGWCSKMVGLQCRSCRLRVILLQGWYAAKEVGPKAGLRMTLQGLSESDYRVGATPTGKKFLKKLGLTLDGRTLKV